MARPSLARARACLAARRLPESERLGSRICGRAAPGRLPSILRSVHSNAILLLALGPMISFFAGIMLAGFPEVLAAFGLKPGAGLPDLVFLGQRWPALEAHLALRMLIACEAGALTAGLVSWAVFLLTWETPGEQVVTAARLRERRRERERREGASVARRRASYGRALDGVARSRARRRRGDGSWN